MKIRHLLAVFACVAAVSPLASAETLPLETFFKKPQFTNFQVSPNGKELAALTDRERARVRITHAIRTTMRRLALHHAALSEHLRATVSTGTYCAYRPDPRRPVEWEL